MRELLPMSLADLDVAPFRYTATGILPCSPRRLFEELGEPARWLAWFPLMHRARWTSFETARVGAEREVAIYGFGQFRETILAYEPAARFAFTMTATTSPLARQMAEDYRITDAVGGARLDWTLAAVPTRLGRLATKALPTILAAIWYGALRHLDAQLETSDRSRRGPRIPLPSIPLAIGPK